MSAAVRHLRPITLERRGPESCLLVFHDGGPGILCHDSRRFAAELHWLQQSHHDEHTHSRLGLISLRTCARGVSFYLRGDFRCLLSWRQIEALISDLKPYHSTQKDPRQ